MRITPQDIHRQEFSRSVRGYTVEEVDAFLERVADELEHVHQDNTKLRDQLKGLVTYVPREPGDWLDRRGWLEEAVEMFRFCRPFMGFIEEWHDLARGGEW